MIGDPIETAALAGIGWEFDPKDNRAVPRPAPPPAPATHLPSTLPCHTVLCGLPCQTGSLPESLLPLHTTRPAPAATPRPAPLEPVPSPRPRPARTEPSSSEH